MAEKYGCIYYGPRTMAVRVFAKELISAQVTVLPLVTTAPRKYISYRRLRMKKSLDLKCTGSSFISTHGMCWHNDNIIMAEKQTMYLYIDPQTVFLMISEEWTQFDTDG